MFHALRDLTGGNATYLPGTQERTWFSMFSQLEEPEGPYTSETYIGSVIGFTEEGAFIPSNNLPVLPRGFQGIEDRNENFYFEEQHEALIENGNFVENLLTRQDEQFADAGLFSVYGAFPQPGEEQNFYDQNYSLDDVNQAFAFQEFFERTWPIWYTYLQQNRQS
jgi:hypothetical protein